MTIKLDGDAGVTTMHSLMNLSSGPAVKSLIKYQKLDNMLEGIADYSSKLMNDARSEIARGVYEYKNKTENVEYISETQSIAEGLLNVGMRTDNPVIKDIINRAFMGQTIDMLRRPHTKNGTSSYLITGELPVKLNNPVFRRFVSNKPGPKGEEGRSAVVPVGARIASSSAAL